MSDGESKAPPGGAMARDSGELVAFAGCEVVAVNGAMSLLLNAASGAQSVVAPEVVAALANCGSFAPIAAHTDTICRLTPQLASQRQAVQGTLGKLAEAGILTRAQALAGNLASASPRRLAPTRVVIISADRPAMLERLLESLLHGGSLQPHNHLLLIDDSQDADNAARNAALVEHFNIRSSRDMQYFGAPQQREFLDALRAACPEEQASIDFLLQPQRWPAGQRYGRVRSLALLLTVGYRCLVLDDDILCRALASPFREDGLRLGSSRERMALFDSDRDTLLRGARALDESPLRLHSEVLGQRLGTLPARFGGLELEGSNGDAALTLAADAPVLLTQCGSWGDPGTADPHWALQLRRDAVERLAASGDLRSLLEARCCWFGCTRPTLMKAGFMSQMTGLDNSELLPPYFPAYRGEDQVFGSMLNALYPHSAILEFDWGVPHLPEPGRGSGSLRQPIPRQPSLGLCARLIDNLVDYRSDESAPERLGYLALQLRRLARRDGRELTQLYRSLLASARAEQLQRLGALAQETAELPSATWQGYLRRALEEVQGALARPASLRDIGGDAERIAADLTAAVRGFADALEAWPALRDAAARIAPASPG